MCICINVLKSSTTTARARRFQAVWHHRVPSCQEYPMIQGSLSILEEEEGKDWGKWAYSYHCNDSLSWASGDIKVCSPMIQLRYGKQPNMHYKNTRDQLKWFSSRELSHFSWLNSTLCVRDDQFVQYFSTSQKDKTNIKRSAYWNF